ncbi:MAG: CRISPR-associated endonuclease Cas2 [Candidatus Syntropharchaeia archaeon]
METLVIYDITDDRLRTKVSKILKNFGCVRVQKSAFLGDMNRNMRDKLKIELERTIGKDPGNIQIYPLCNKCFGWRESIGDNYEIEEEEIEIL